MYDIIMQRYKKKITIHYLLIFVQYMAFMIHAFYLFLSFPCQVFLNINIIIKNKCVLSILKKWLYITNIVYIAVFLI